MGYSFQLAARYLLYASSHRQDSAYHDLYYTRCEALDQCLFLYWDIIKHSFVCLFVCSFVRLFVHLFVRLFIHSLDVHMIVLKPGCYLDDNHTDFFNLQVLLSIFSHRCNFFI